MVYHSSAGIVHAYDPDAPRKTVCSRATTGRGNSGSTRAWIPSTPGSKIRGFVVNDLSVAAASTPDMAPGKGEVIDLCLDEDDVPPRNKHPKTARISETLHSQLKADKPASDRMFSTPDLKNAALAKRKPTTGPKVSMQQMPDAPSKPARDVPGGNGPARAGAKRARDEGPLEPLAKKRKVDREASKPASRSAHATPAAIEARSARPTWHTGFIGELQAMPESEKKASFDLTKTLAPGGRQEGVIDISDDEVEVLSTRRLPKSPTVRVPVATASRAGSAKPAVAGAAEGRGPSVEKATEDVKSRMRGPVMLPLPPEERPPQDAVSNVVEQARPALTSGANARESPKPRDRTPGRSSVLSEQILATARASESADAGDSAPTMARESSEREVRFPARPVLPPEKKTTTVTVEPAKKGVIPSLVESSDATQSRARSPSKMEPDTFRSVKQTGSFNSHRAQLNAAKMAMYEERRRKRLSGSGGSPEHELAKPWEKPKRIDSAHVDVHDPPQVQQERGAKVGIDADVPSKATTVRREEIAKVGIAPGDNDKVEQANTGLASPPTSGNIPHTELMMAPYSPMATLGLSKQVEAVLGKYLEELRGDNEYWTRTLLRRARLSLGDVAISGASTVKQGEDQPYDFGRLKPLQLVPASKKPVSGDFANFEVERWPTGGSKAIKTALACPATILTSLQDMPSYAHYVEIKQNFLAPNVTTMQAWPYFNDEFNFTRDVGLDKQFYMDVVGRPKKLVRLMQAQRHEEYVESALRDLQITWDDVLRFLLELRPDVGRERDALQGLARRKESCVEEFSHDDERRAIVLSSLPGSSQERLAKASTLCENFLRMAKFSLWHVARRHMYDRIPAHDEKSGGDQIERLTCRICLRFDCPYHGEITDPEDLEEEPVRAEKAAVHTDIVHPPIVNHRTPTAFAPRPASAIDSGTAAPTKQSLKYWQDKSFFTTNLVERGPFQPCYHPGQSCKDAACSCFTLKVPCEKACVCPASCLRKFLGCACRHNKLKRCFDDSRCLCFELGRECDPDLCGFCGVADVLDPVHRHDAAVLRGKCHNASLQRGVPKRTALGTSLIHGLGLFAAEPIGPDDFVGEYKGEVITTEEAERRGAVYEHQKLSYLFLLNSRQEIDSTYFGNAIRFINHGLGAKANLYPRIQLVDTVHRIGLFAREGIRAGEELLFDYGPKFLPHALGGTKASARRAGAVQRELWDAETLTDGQGHRTAMKATGQGRQVRKERAAPLEKNSVPPGLRGKAAKKAAAAAPAGSAVQGLDVAQSAEDRLAAYNISDDGPGLVAMASDPEDNEFEPDGSGDEKDESSSDDEMGSDSDRANGTPRRRGRGQVGRGRRGGFRGRGNTSARGG
ncbi:hypothetical protein LTR53_011851 [Teratosphaeriaceae sp. CCFEE 6253]|nr:hypothetical protein LTR53_011851 [Teratosphaeriaceae sp. CCFEE 6253]